MTESDHQLVGTIKPELIAEKLQAIRNLEYPELLKQITAEPRLVEMMWFLQHTSMQPGGLVKFSADMVEQMPGRFGTATMRGANRAEYTLDVKDCVLGELALRYRPLSAPDEPESDWRFVRSPFDEAEESVSREITANLDANRRRELERFLKSWTPQEMQDTCQRAAIALLPRYLEDICVEQGMGFIRPLGEDYWKSPFWFMDDPVAAVLEMMDRRAAEISKRLAMTAIAKKVFDVLDYALEERVMVRIEGDSRLGKSEAIKAWADMRPGLARVVEVPFSNLLGDLVCRVAQSLGIEARYRARPEVLRDRVGYVLQQSRIFLILDESHYLIPQTYTRTTAPQRLNWVRGEVVDRGLPLALIHTPQTFLEDADKFVKKTHFAMQQFFGRVYRTVQLPDELSRADLISVARIHFPEACDEHLEEVADEAETSENYLQTVEAIAKLARHLARSAGRRRITDSDLQVAIFEVNPRRPAPVAASGTAAPSQAVLKVASAPNERAVQAPLKSRAGALQAGRIRPADGECEAAFPLRGVEPELVHADS